MRRIDVDWTKVALHILLISNILIAQNNLAYAQDNDRAVAAGNLDINIYSDLDTTSAGNPINITIEIINLRCQEREFRFTQKFNEIIVSPSKNLNIIIGEKPKQIDGHHCELSNNISDNKNYGSTLDRNGKITIAGHIKGNSRILTNYRTFIKNNTPPGSYPIFSRIEETHFWYEHPDDFSSERPKHTIKTISILEDPDSPKPPILCIDIDPKYNRTDSSETSISIFEGTKLKISLLGNEKNPDNISFYDSYNGMILPPIDTPTSYGVRQLGNHSFFAKVDPGSKIYNNTTFNVINLMEYHKKLVRNNIIYLLILPLLALSIPFGLHRKFGHSNSWVTLFISLLIFIIYLWHIFNYSLNDGIYKDLIVFSYISLYAGLYLLLYIYNNGKANKWVIIIQAIGMVAIIAYFNYYIEFLFSKSYISLIMLLIPIITGVILNKITKVSKERQSIVVVILTLACFFAVPIISIVNSEIAFSSRFDLYHLLAIIILLELVPLIIIAIAGIFPELFIQIANDKAPKPTEASDKKDNTE
jgi:hypothetical protein